MTGRLLLLLALPCACDASKLPPAVENAVDFCISSRWGFSCFDASTSSRGVIARAGMAGVGRMVGRGALATMGALVARETWVTMRELQQNKAGMAHQTLRQWLMDGPLPPTSTATAPAPAGITTGPILAADAVAEEVTAEPMLAAEDIASPAPPARATPDPISSSPAAAGGTMKAVTSLDAAPAARAGAAPSASSAPREAASLPRSFPSRRRASSRV
jgi:hypothetical protein